MSSGGVIGFSLGLATNAFISGLDQARSGIGGLVGAGLRLPVIGAAVATVGGSFLTLDAIVNRTFEQINKGADLADLSQRTGETVKNLYLLERGFEGGGVAGEAVTGMLSRMRKALGGFNEQGEPTKDIFDGIGLSVEALKELDAPEALEAILKKLALLNRNEGQAAASKIFGGSGAGDALQLARSFEDVQEAMQEAAAQAAVFQRNADAFDKIDKSIRQLTDRGTHLFAGIAAGAAPGIQAALDALNSLDLSGIGERIGASLSVVGEAVKQGRIGEFLSLALQAGFEQGTNAIVEQVGGLVGVLKGAFASGDFWSGLFETGMGVFGKLGAALLKVFESPLIYLQAGLEKIIQDRMWMVSKIPGLAQALGLEDFQPQSMREILAERQKEGLSIFGSSTVDIQAMADVYLKDGLESLKVAGPELAKAFQEGREAFRNILGGAKAAELNKLYDQLKSQIKDGAAPEDPDGKIEGAVGAKGKITQQANSLEKVGGLFFFGGSGPDYARQTSQNTARLVDEIRGLRNDVKKPTKAEPFVNI